MSEENFDAINKYYRDNPPPMVLDDDGVRHIKDIPLPAKYELHPCQCGIVHSPESDSWYHEVVKLTADRSGVYRACKECRQVLLRRIWRR